MAKTRITSDSKAKHCNPARSGAFQDDVIWSHFYAEEYGQAFLNG